MAGIRIGELLVEQGVLTQRQVEHILKIQKISNRPFGDLAERLYGIDAKAVEDCQTWLIQQKQVWRWPSTIATADAIHAVMLDGTAPTGGKPQPALSSAQL